MPDPRTVALASTVAVLVVACSDSDATGAGGAGGSGSSAIATTTTTSTSAPTGATTSTGGGPCPGTTLTTVANSEFCDAVAAPLDCSALTPSKNDEVCGVVLGVGSTEVERSTSVARFGGSGPPQVDCLAPPNYPPKADVGSSKAIVMSGVARIFSSGCESKNVTIQLYEASLDGTLGAPIGTSFTTSGDCQAAGGVAENDDNCGTRYLCPYSYSIVPTERELVIKTSGAVWAPVYEYGVYVSNLETPGGTWQHDVMALATDDYSVLPQVALGGPIVPGHGTLLGEVHDCGDVRLLHASAAVSVPPVAFTYFNQNETHPLPDISAQYTGAVGLFAAFDLPPGKVAVAAAGSVNGAPTTLGFMNVSTFPNAVTFVTLRGVQPFQVP